MADFGPVETFGIDDGELDGLTPQRCFVLGVEWERVRQSANEADGFARPVHAENMDRIKAILGRRNRKYSLTFMHEDASENWLWLEVAPEEDKP